MSRSGIKIIGITMGDPTGIGPEIIAKALSIPGIKSLADFICVGDAKLLKGIPAQVIHLPYRSAGEGALKFLKHAVGLVKAGKIQALVTAPLSKEAVSRYEKNFHGHTEYLAQAFGVKRFDMMFIGPKVRLSLVTRHVPVKEVARLVTTRAVLSSIELMHDTLKKFFKVKDPRIAVLGLNPHAGEHGLLGNEDADKIVPAIHAARKRGIKADGPFAADTFFIRVGTASKIPLSPREGFDGVVAMYHDQGLAPLKALYFKELVNFTAGLPFVRTSPVHGTAFDIAGKGRADPSSMIVAIKLACRLA